MSDFMEKWIYGVVFGVIIFAGFWLSVFTVRAEEVTGSEGVFTHSHNGGCYEDVRVSCDSKHTEKGKVIQVVQYCATCGGDTSQHSWINEKSCPIQGVTWQENCYTACNVCCTYSAQWTQPRPGGHVYTERQLVCGMEAGEVTAKLKIIADSSWTNDSVTIHAKTEVLKQDLSSDGIVLDWENGMLCVTENGFYTVTATNSRGSTVSSTIQIFCIDKITPVINGRVGNEATMTENGIEVSVSASDGESGLADLPYSLDGGITWGCVSTFKVEEGKPVSFAVRDKAGNVTACTISRNQFPYPPKVPAAVTPPAENKNSAAGPPDAQNPVINKEAEPAKQEEIMVEKTKEEPKEKPENEEEKKEKSKELETSVVSKKILTKEEREQAYGISLILQKRARDAFFIGGRMKSTPEEIREEENNADIPVKEVVVEREEVSQPAGTDSPVTMTWLQQNAITCIGFLLCVSATGGIVYLMWLHTAVLYCYDGGEAYRKIGLFQIKRGKKELEIYLPDYILQSTKAFRYRLMLRNRLVKRCGNQELVVYNEDNKLRQQVEECVDFVL